MVECIFTIDYEIYGNGEGSLTDLVLEPAKELKAIFDRAGSTFTVFVEAAELEKMDTLRTDPAIDAVKDQIRDFHQEGFEIALHLHPQWCNAQYQNGAWALDHTEYNLCPLGMDRINEIVEGAIAYLRSVVSAPAFTPISFRAGNWLFQPTRTLARVLANHNIKIDSSVFKGGLQHEHNLDYRRAVSNGYYWTFRDDVTRRDPAGPLLEIPIHTRMVPFWKMVTAKRISLQQKGAVGARRSRQRIYRLLDFIRFWQPLKFDFCRMTLPELVSMVEAAISQDRLNPELLTPIVAIGHTKDLVDFRSIELFLSYLKKREIPISTLRGIYEKCVSTQNAVGA
jgi:hypothetical protein